MNTLVKLLKKYWPILLILAVFLIAYGKTLQMYFWQDDSALIFKLQHQAEASGSFGKGLWERSPYQYLVVPFVPFFPLFGLEPFGYFLVGFISYIIAGWVFYLFAKELFNNKKHAYISTLIFAAGYVGSDIMFRVINSWQTNIGLILCLFTLRQIVVFHKNRTLAKYLLALGLFLFTIEAVFVRTHSLIFVVFALDLILSFPLSVKRFISLIIRQIPFWILFYIWYVKGESIGGGALNGIVKQILSGQVGVFATLIATTGNALVADFWQAHLVSVFPDVAALILTAIVVVVAALFKLKSVPLFIGAYFINVYLYSLNLFWYKTESVYISGLIGLFGIAFVISLLLSLWKKEKELVSVIVFGFIFIVSQIFGYFIQYPTAIFSTTHRYLSFPFLGYCIFYGGIIALLLKQKKRVIVAKLLLGFIILTNLYLGFTYQSKLVTERSMPSRNFYHDLKSFVPSFEKGSVFYFDVRNDGLTQRQFSDSFSVGSMPETTAIAIYYGVDRYDLSLVTEFNELIYKIDNEDIDIDKVYTFYYGINGLVDTTNNTRQLLRNGSRSTSLPLTPLTPVEINVTLRAVPDSSLTLPYLQGSKHTSILTTEQKLRSLKFLKNRQEFYRRAKVATTSEWRYREVENIADQNISTPWQGHRIAWGKNPLEQVTIDLGSIQGVDRLIWHSWDDTLSAVDYSIEVSLDAKTWQQVKKVNDSDGKKDGEVVVEQFASTSARFVRLSITKTLSGDSPAIIEIMADGGYMDVDPANAFEFSKNPFYGITTVADWQRVFSEFSPLAKISLTKVSDKGDSEEVVQNVVLDTYNHTYTVLMQSGGTSLSDVKVTPQFPGSIEVISLNGRNLSFDEIKQRGLIKRYSTN